MQTERKFEKLTLRIPKRVYDRMQVLKTRKPHMSINALIIEAIDRQMSVEREVFDETLERR